MIYKIECSPASNVVSVPDSRMVSHGFIFRSGHGYAVPLSGNDGHPFIAPLRMDTRISSAKPSLARD